MANWVEPRSNEPPGAPPPAEELMTHLLPQTLADSAPPRPGNTLTTQEADKMNTELDQQVHTLIFFSTKCTQQRRLQATTQPT